MPTVETLEKLARAMEIPMYQLFYEPMEHQKHATPEKNGGVATLTAEHTEGG